MRRRAIIGKSKAVASPTYTGFAMRIKTTTANQVFTLPTKSGSGYNATVFWGDGTQSSVTGHNVNNAKTYAVAGNYDIEIRGQFDSIYFNTAGSKSLVTHILNWGGSDFQGFTTMNKAFYGCDNLISIAEGGIKERTPITDFSSAFRDCNKITTLPTDLFRHNTAVTSFYFTFSGCTELTSLPTDLFKENKSVTNFSYTFSSTKLITLPVDLFRHNTAVTSFGYTFYGCTGLTSLPADLFRYNTAVTDFGGVLTYCDKLTLRSDIFGASPNFGTRVMEFSDCFSKGSWTGSTQGTAPALWSATMDASSTKARCFGGIGNNTTSLSNYNSIPGNWIS